MLVLSLPLVSSVLGSFSLCIPFLYFVIVYIIIIVLVIVVVIAFVILMFIFIMFILLSFSSVVIFAISSYLLMIWPNDIIYLIVGIDVPNPITITITIIFMHCLITIPNETTI